MEHGKHIDVLGLGSVTVDFVGNIRGWPEKGVKKPLESFAICDGGLVGTALVAVSRLGGNAAFAGKLGQSEMARRALDALAKEKIDTSFIIRTEDAEPIVAFVLTDSADGQRNIFWTKQGTQYPMPDEFPVKDWFKKVSVLLIDSVCGRAGIEAAGMARQYNIPVVIDIERNEPHAAEAMALATHIIVGEDFAADFTGKSDTTAMLKCLQRSPEQTVIITLGRKGCVGLSNDGIFELPAYKVEVVDTTGCGDVFHGAYALAVARRKSVIEAARFASAAAALCATKLGGRAGIPTMNQLQSFIDAQQ